MRATDRYLSQRGWGYTPSFASSKYALQGRPTVREDLCLPNGAQDFHVAGATLRLLLVASAHRLLTLLFTTGELPQLYASFISLSAAGYSAALLSFVFNILKALFPN